MNFNQSKAKNPNAFYIIEGFAKYEKFINANYESLGPDGFNSLGLLNWSQRMLSDEQGKFSIDLTDYNQRKGKTIIEGMTTDGVLFQEELVIELK